MPSSRGFCGCWSCRSRLSLRALRATGRCGQRFCLRPTPALDHRGSNPLLYDLGGLLPLEVAFDALDDVGLDSAHVVAHVADSHGLKERDQRLLVHV